MFRFLTRFLAVLTIGVGGAGLLGAESTDSDEPAVVDEAISRLKASGILLRCVKGGAFDEVNTAEEVEFIELGGGRHGYKTVEATEELFEILTLFPDLQRLYLRQLVFEPDWLRLLSDSPNLRALAFERCSKSFREADSLDILVASLPELESLELDLCNIPDSMLEKLLPLESLQTLSLFGNKRITEASLPTLRKLETLETLNMSRTGLDGSIADVYRFAGELRTLMYLETPVKNRPLRLEELPEFFTILPAPRNSRKIFYKTDASLADIAALLPGPVTALRTTQYGTTLSGTSPSSEKYVFRIHRWPNDADLAGIGKMTELLSLELERSIYSSRTFLISNDGLRHLADLGKLETLTLDRVLTLDDGSIAALAGLRNLRKVDLRRFRLGKNNLSWLRFTPNLSELSLTRGTLDSAAVADLGRATSLEKVRLDDVSITRTPDSVRIPNVTSLTFCSRVVEPDEIDLIGRFPSLDSLTIEGAVSDETLLGLAHLERLSYLKLARYDGSAASREAIPTRLTPTALQQLRGITTYLQLRGLTYPGEQQVADQFGWRFCYCGCCDILPRAGVQWTADDIQGDRPDPTVLQREPDPNEQYERQGNPAAVRLRGPMWIDRLVLREEDVPEGAGRLFVTDCRIGELRFEGWMPETIRFWGDCRIDRITTVDVAADARSDWTYKHYDVARELVVPASEHLARLVIENCDELESLRLIGLYPNLVEMKLRDVNHLKYLAAPYSGDAPRLDITEGSAELLALPCLRLLKMPGTALGASSLDSEDDPLPPGSLHEVDLRDTPIDDRWLGKLADCPSLRVLRIGECENLTDEGKAAFRQSRPGVRVDEQTQHRPELWTGR